MERFFDDEEVWWVAELINHAGEELLPDFFFGGGCLPALPKNVVNLRIRL